MFLCFLKQRMLATSSLLLLLACKFVDSGDEPINNRVDRDAPKYARKLDRLKGRKEDVQTLQVSSIRTEKSFTSTISSHQVIHLMSAEEMSACRENLSAADKDGNGQLKASEYANFISLSSGKALQNGSFRDLGAAFKALYFADICTVCYKQTADNNCCVGNTTGINLSNDDSTMLICSVVPRELEEIIEPTYLCVDWAYTLNNRAGLSAEDIMNEVGNDLKDGLEAAGNSVAVAILNEAFPDGNASRNLKLISEDVHLAHRLGHPEAHAVDSTSMSLQEKALYDTRSEERLWKKSPVGHSRQLVSFNDDRPSEVTRVVDSAECPDPEVDCVIVEQRVCVEIEDEDDPKRVRDALRDGIWDALDSGDFLAALPSEYLP